MDPAQQEAHTRMLYVLMNAVVGFTFQMDQSRQLVDLVGVSYTGDGGSSVGQGRLCVRGHPEPQREDGRRAGSVSEDGKKER